MQRMWWSRMDRKFILDTSRFIYQNREQKMKKFEMILQIRNVISNHKLSKMEMICKIYKIINEAN